MGILPNVKSIQDLPPAGGYPSIPVTKGIRPRGPPGWAIWGGVIGCTVFGFYQLGKTNERKRLALKEKREARMAILPYLQAEQDRDLTRKIDANFAKETEAMKGVEGWEVGKNIYSKRWYNPIY